MADSLRSDDARLHQETVTIRGRPVSFQVAGHGDPLVLVHGLAGSGRWWRRNLPALSAHFRVYVIDLPRFGSMRRDPTPFSIAGAAYWLHGWFTAAGVDRADVVGHSMGGAICIRMAATWPKVVRRLVLVAPAGIGRGRPLAAHSLSLLVAAQRSTPSFLPMLLHDATSAGPSTVLRAARELLAQDMQPELSSIRAPTLVVLGERDPLIPEAIGHIVEAAIPSARTVVIPGAGHVVMYDRPREFDAALLDFLARDRGSRAAATPSGNTSV